MSRSPPQLRIALLLGVAGAWATALLFPYLLALKPGALAGLPVTPGVLMLAQSLQAGVIVFLLAWAGLKLGATSGLGAPWLAAWLYARPRPAAANWPLAIALGASAAVTVLVAIAAFGAPLEAIRTPALWKGLLAAPYGAIVEETACRVFLMGSVAWLLGRCCASEAKPWIMPAAIVVAALLFGAGHLPAASQLAPLTAAIVVRVLAYNAIAGLAFGWLYWKRGLEHAVLAHLCADLVLHVAAPAMA